MSEALRDQTLSPFDYKKHLKSEDESGLPKFGYPTDNYGWIECVSKSFPGQMYYFNVDTCCSTWNRPVSRFIPTGVTRPLNLMSDEDFLDDAPIEVSDIENENDDDEEEYDDEEINPDLPPDADDLKRPVMKVTKVSREAKMYGEVLFKLYHCYSYDWNDIKIENGAPIKRGIFDDDSTENYESFLAETCYSSDSDGVSRESKLRTITKNKKNSGTLDDHESFVDVFKEDEDRLSEVDYLKVLHTNNMEIKNRENTLNTSASRLVDSDIASRDFELSSDDEEDDKEDEITGSKCLFSLPRLKAIEFEDLSRPSKSRKGKNAKKRKASNKNDETLKKTPPNKMTKIVCTLNGVTTVNYDYLPPELPSGVKMSNLSDSVSSDGCYDASHSQENKNVKKNCSNERSTEATKNLNFFDDLKDFSELDLSESSNSSASSKRVKKIRTKKVLKLTKRLKFKEKSKPNELFSSSSSSESSWKNSCSSSDDDD